MDKNIEGDEYFDYSSETLERGWNVRAVSLDAFAFLNGWVSIVDKEFDCRQEQGGQVVVAVYGDTQSSTYTYSAN